MPKYRPIQNSFAAGELSPLMSAKSDSEGYKKGAEIMENFIPLTQGPAVTRGGSEYIDALLGNAGRVFSFPVSTFVGFVVTVTDEYICIFDAAGRVSVTNLVTNGDFIEGGTGWTDISVGAGVVNFISGGAELNPGNPPTNQAGIRQNITGLTGTSTHMISIIRAIGEDDLTVNIGTTAGGTDIHSQIYSSLATIEIDLVAGPTDIWIDIFAPGGLEPSRTLSKVEMIDTSGAPVYVQWASPWTTATQIVQLQAKMPPTENAMYFANPEVAPYVLTYNSVTRTWTFAALTLTGLPSGWTGNVWPGAITFFEGRLWLCGTRLEPETIWASKATTPPSYGDFTTGSNPSDGMELVLNVRGAIKWIEGLKNLLVGTETGEHIIKGQNGIIVPGDIHSYQQSANGSISMQPEKVGNKVIYVSGDGRKVRAMNYQWTDEAWMSRDLTYASSHIAGVDVISEISYAKNPQSIVVMATSGGTLIVCSYTGETDKVGWSRHNLCTKCVGTCVLEYGSISEIWVIVRDYDETGLCLVRINSMVALDGHKFFHSEEPTKYITGMEHLAGKTVQVLADGTVHPDVYVDTNGEAILDYEATNVYLGFAYEATLKTMPFDSTTQTGSSRSKRKRWNKVVLRVIDSAMPKINGERPSERDVDTNMDTPESPVTGNIKVDNRGWDEDGQLTIVQDLPLRTIVAGIFGELNQEGL